MFCVIVHLLSPIHTLMDTIHHHCPYHINSQIISTRPFTMRSRQALHILTSPSCNGEPRRVIITMFSFNPTLQDVFHFFLWILRYEIRLGYTVQAYFSMYIFRHGTINFLHEQTRTRASQHLSHVTSKSEGKFVYV